MVFPPGETRRKRQLQLQLQQSYSLIPGVGPTPDKWWRLGRLAGIRVESWTLAKRQNHANGGLGGGLVGWISRIAGLLG